jgi:hypothetical protein
LEVAPALDVNNNWFSDSATLLSAWNSGFRTLSDWSPDTLGVYPSYMDHGYNWIMYAATAIAEPFSDGALTGQGSWNWFVSANAAWSGQLGSNLSSCSGDSSAALTNCDNPKWALAPRTSTLAVAACDLNGDGIVNVLDVQTAVNQAIAGGACTTCNVPSVQRVVAAALGGACGS